MKQFRIGMIRHISELTRKQKQETTQERGVYAQTVYEMSKLRMTRDIAKLIIQWMRATNRTKLYLRKDVVVVDTESLLNPCRD